MKHMKHRFYLIDAFTNVAFKGNPAGVVIPSCTLTESQMQNLAMEFGFSETSFISKEGGQYVIRWFTPTVEAALCGHATLAAAHALWTQDLESSREIIFLSQSGELKASRSESGDITLDFPKEQMEVISDVHPILVQEFGSKIKKFGKSRLDYVLELETEEHVANYNPNFIALTKLGRGLIISARSKSEEYDFVCRVFAPSEGIPEDPVTGSAYCCLAPYWSSILLKTELIGKQLSKRSGIVKTKVNGMRVSLLGKATTVLSGDINSDIFQRA